MGADLYEAYPEFRAVLDSAEVGFDLKTVSFTDPDGVLNQTEYTQPCMVAFAAGMTAILAGKGIRPDYAAGLSLGEYSALCAAGVFTAKQAVELAAFRGRAMAAAAAGVPCGMTAGLGLDRDKLRAACEAAAPGGGVGGRVPPRKDLPGEHRVGRRRNSLFRFEFVRVLRDPRL